MTICKRASVWAIGLTLAGCGDDVAGTSDAASGSSSSTSWAAESTGEPTPTTGDGFELLCTPGQERCADEVTREVCSPTGLRWEASACGAHQSCTASGADMLASCVGPCEVASATPSSLGCEFLAMRIRSGNGGEDPSQVYDALIVGNPGEQAVSVQLSFAAHGSQQDADVGEPVVLAAGAAHVFEMSDKAIDVVSGIRTGGVYRVKSDLPVIAYLHSPLKNSDSNDSSLLLPVQALRQDYVVASYPGYVNPDKPDVYAGRPSYFNVVALENNTVVQFSPKADTYGNKVTVDPVAKGMTGQVILHKRDVLQVGAKTPEDADFAGQDVSGAVIHADKPVWVLGGTSCARVPFDSAGSCNHLQEQMIPTEYWGTHYYAAHAPLRAAEKHYWRVYAGADGVSVATNPAQPGGAFTLMKKGDVRDVVVASGNSFAFHGNGPFMPVQYLASNAEAAKIGDPAMVQTIPVQQHLKRYVFVTGIGFDLNYAQVVREHDGAEVYVNGEPVGDYYFVNGGSFESGGELIPLRYDAADVLLDTGGEARVFVVESEEPFGVSVFGYASGAGGNSAYAYPGGMALNKLGEG
jgi:hypothetical protein